MNRKIKIEKYNTLVHYEEDLPPAGAKNSLPVPLALCATFLGTAGACLVVVCAGSCVNNHSRCIRAATWKSSCSACSSVGICLKQCGHAYVVASVSTARFLLKKRCIVDARVSGEMPSSIITGSVGDSSLNRLSSGNERGSTAVCACGDDVGNAGEKKDFIPAFCSKLVSVEKPTTPIEK